MAEIGYPAALTRAIREEDESALAECVRRAGDSVLWRRRTDGRDALRVAVSLRAPRALRWLIARVREAGREPDLQGLLFDSIKGDAPACARVVLASGAAASHPGPGGYTPLHEACVRNRAEVVSVLAEFGADLEAITADKHTPLGLASARGCTAAARAMLEAGADVNRLTKGSTPLQFAAYNGHRAAAEVLVAFGADIDKRNKAGRDAVEMAELRAGVVGSGLTEWLRAVRASRHLDEVRRTAGPRDEGLSL